MSSKNSFKIKNIDHACQHVHSRSYNLLRHFIMKTDPSPIELLDVVALLCDHPELDTVTGQVGTVVAILDPHTVEVEFVTESGETFAQGAVPATDLLVLHYSPVAA